MNQRDAQNRSVNPAGDIRVRIYNADSVAIPPRGVCAITGVDADGLITVTRPTRDDQTDVLVNGPVAINPGRKGSANPAFPAVAAYAPDPNTGAPRDGEIWGVLKDSWYLQRARPGFRVVGTGANGLCNVVPMSRQYLSFVVVTSCFKTNNWYPATELVYDPVNDAWASYDGVWIREANGYELLPGVRYLAMLQGFVNAKRAYHTFRAPDDTCSSSSSSSAPSAGSDSSTPSGSSDSSGSETGSSLSSDGSEGSASSSGTVPLTVVTDIQCVNGNLLVTKKCVQLPAGTVVTAGSCT